MNPVSIINRRIFWVIIQILFLLTSLSLSLSSPNDFDCGIGSLSTEKVINGIIAPTGAYPWMLQLYTFGLTSGNLGKCGGFLIGSRHAIAAAHCVLAGMNKWMVNSLSRVAVVSGLQDLNTYNLTHLNRVDKVYFIDEYLTVDNSSTDIAIIEFAKPIDFDQKVRPICLPESDDTPFKKLIIAGFGGVNGSEYSPTNLLHTDVDYIPNPECLKMFKDFIEINYPGIDTSAYINLPTLMICAKNNESGDGVCRGDPGSALMYKNNGRYYAIGVTSSSIRCGPKSNLPYYFTRISKHKEFISTVVEDARFCAYN